MRKPPVPGPARPRTPPWNAFRVGVSDPFQAAVQAKTVMPAGSLATTPLTDYARSQELRNLVLRFCDASGITMSPRAYLEST